MAKRRRRGKAKYHFGKLGEISKKRGHKPVALLKFYHARMERNLGRLENLIDRRERAGE